MSNPTPPPADRDASLVKTLELLLATLEDAASYAMVARDLLLNQSPEDGG